MIDDSPPQVNEANDAQQGSRPRRRMRTRSLILAVAVAAVWMGIVRDPQVGPLVLLLSGALGLALALMGVAMGLGLLGFGLCSACDRALGWLRRASQWPDE
jgi:hypothetical protein